MWPLVKALISYNRRLLAAAYLTTAVIWGAYIFDPASKIMLFGVPAVFLNIALFISGVKEKRERLHALLPIPIAQRGLAKTLSFAALFHLALFSLWPLQHLVARARMANEFITFPGLLALSGITIAIFLLIAIRFDLPHNSKRGSKWLANSVLAIALSSVLALRLAVEIRPAVYDALLRLTFETPFVALAANLLCAGLFFLHRNVYRRRDSFLEELVERRIEKIPLFTARSHLQPLISQKKRLQKYFVSRILSRPHPHAAT